MIDWLELSWSQRGFFYFFFWFSMLECCAGHGMRILFMDTLLTGLGSNLLFALMLTFLHLMMDRLCQGNLFLIGYALLFALIVSLLQWLPLVCTGHDLLFSIGPWGFWRWFDHDAIDVFSEAVALHFADVCGGGCVSYVDHWFLKYFVTASMDSPSFLDFFLLQWDYVFEQYLDATKDRFWTYYYESLDSRNIPPHWFYAILLKNVILNLIWEYFFILLAMYYASKFYFVVFSLYSVVFIIILIYLVLKYYAYI